MNSSSAKYFFLFSTAILFALIGSRSFGGMDVDELSFSEKWINQKATVESECKEHSITLTKSISSAILKVEKSSSVENKKLRRSKSFGAFGRVGDEDILLPSPLDVKLLSGMDRRDFFVDLWFMADDYPEEPGTGALIEIALESF